MSKKWRAKFTLVDLHPHGSFNLSFFIFISFLDVKVGGASLTRLNPLWKQIVRHLGAMRR